MTQANGNVVSVLLISEEQTLIGLDTDVVDLLV